LIANEKILALEDLFDLVQGLEHGVHCGLICFGGARETGFINPI
jgi:hypothetical protein